MSLSFLHAVTFSVYWGLAPLSQRPRLCPRKRWIALSIRSEWMSSASLCLILWLRDSETDCWLETAAAVILSCCQTKVNWAGIWSSSTNWWMNLNVVRSCCTFAKCFLFTSSCHLCFDLETEPRQVLLFSRRNTFSSRCLEEFLRILKIPSVNRFKTTFKVFQTSQVKDFFTETDGFLCDQNICWCMRGTNGGYCYRCSTERWSAGLHL